MCIRDSPALWLKPMNQMMTVPFIGKLNTVFIVAVGFGMFLILVAMVLHIINGIKAHDQMCIRDRNMQRIMRHWLQAY